MRRVRRRRRRRHVHRRRAHRLPTHLAGEGADHARTTSGAACSHACRLAATRAGTTLGVAPARGAPLRPRHDRGHERARRRASAGAVGLITTEGLRGARAARARAAACTTTRAGSCRRRRSSSPRCDRRRRRAHGPRRQRRPPLDPSEVVAAARAPSSNASTSRRSRSRSCGRSATRSTSSRRSIALARRAARRRRSSRAPRCIPPSASSSARRSPCSTRTRQGALAGIEQLAGELARRGLPVPLLLVHSAGGSITVAEARRHARSGSRSPGPRPASPPRSRSARPAGVDRRGHLRHGRHVVRRLRRERRRARPPDPRRPHGDLDRAVARRRRVDRRRRRLARLDRRPRDAAGRPAVGRRRSRPRVLRPRRHRGHRHRRARRARLRRPDPLPRRRHGTRRRCRARRVRARSARRSASTPTRPRGASAQLALAGMVKAVRARLAARGLDPRGHALFSYGGCGALFTPEHRRTRSAAPRVLVPELASVLSAFGAATADVRRERLAVVLATVPGRSDRRREGSPRSSRRRSTPTSPPTASRRPIATSRSKPTCASRKQRWELTIPLAGAPLPHGARAARRRLPRPSTRSATAAGRSCSARRRVGEPARRSASAARLKRRTRRTARHRPWPTAPRRRRGHACGPLGRGADGVVAVDVYDGADLLPGTARRPRARRRHRHHRLGPARRPRSSTRSAPRHRHRRAWRCTDDDGTEDR